MTSAAQRTVGAVVLATLAALGMAAAATSSSSSTAPLVATQELSGAPRPHSPGARLLLDEEFDGTSLNLARWGRCHWWAQGGCTIASNHELEWYRAENVSVAGGHLRLEA